MEFEFCLMGEMVEMFIFKAFEVIEAFLECLIFLKFSDSLIRVVIIRQGLSINNVISF